jgi:hypothetical protein
MMRNRSSIRLLALASTIAISITSVSLHAATLAVGPGKTYAAPCAAITAANDGDTIEIDAAGTYDGDVCAIAKNRLTLRGVNGRAKIDAAGKNYGGKGIWVISGNDTTVENIELSGATVPDKNGAGIRQEGANLTVRGCYFHDNEDGILSGGTASSETLIEYSEFANNGAGDGFSHNMYIGHEGRFTLRYSYSHHAKVGHLVKSRAAVNYILYNRISGEDGTSSYEIDLPNAGTSYVIGNLIEQGANTQNSGILTYGLEGTNAQNPGHALFVVNNTFVNDRSAGGTFISIDAAISTAAVVTNNIFFGGGTISTQSSAVLTTNFTTDPMLVNRAGYDYRLATGSPCINAGSDPGMGEGFALVPTRHYVHPLHDADRTVMGTIDIGAYEYGADLDAGGGGASDAMIDSAARDAASDARTDASLDVRSDSPADARTGADTLRDVSSSDGARDGGAGDVSTPDAASTDASIDVAVVDASGGTSPDATQIDPGTIQENSGCGCRTAHGDSAMGPSSWWGAAWGAALVTVARRRVRRSTRGVCTATRPV